MSIHLKALLNYILGMCLRKDTMTTENLIKKNT